MATKTRKPKEAASYACSFCAASREGTRLPRGWKRLGDKTLCQDCLHARYVLRAVTFPVSGPIGAEWSELREALKKAWGQTTRLANWLLDQYYARDARRTPDLEKLPKWTAPYLYPEARSAMPDVPPTTIVAVDHSVAGKYRSQRYELLWLNRRTLANHRYPVPLPIGNQNWRPEWYRVNGEQSDPLPAVWCQVAGTPFLLRLRGGKGFRRQLAGFRQLAAGEAIRGDLTLYRVPARSGSGGRTGASEAGQRYDVMAKLVGWFPRAERIKPDGERFLSLRTDADSLLYGVLQDREEPWIVHADRARDWVHQHQRWLARMADDSKHERRKPKRRRKLALAAYDQRGAKYAARIKSFVQECCSWVVGFAARNGVTRVKYDDSEQGWCDGFPFAMLRERLAVKCDEAGILFERASGDVAAKSRQPLAETETQGV